jgi:hypothetical protein
MSENIICVVCIENLPNNPIELLCGHKYHNNCFESLKKYSRYGIEYIECPQCRIVNYYPQTKLQKLIVKVQSIDIEFIFQLIIGIILTVGLTTILIIFIIHVMIYIYNKNNHT